jgi:hypothetical protein
VTIRERMPRSSTSEGAWLDAHIELTPDRQGNRAQRRKAAKGKRRTEAELAPLRQSIIDEETTHV